MPYTYSSTSTQRKSHQVLCKRTTYTHTLSLTHTHSSCFPLRQTRLRYPCITADLRCWQATLATSDVAVQRPGRCGPQTIVLSQSTFILAECAHSQLGSKANIASRYNHIHGYPAPSIPFLCKCGTTAVPLDPCFMQGARVAHLYRLQSASIFFPCALLPNEYGAQLNDTCHFNHPTQPWQRFITHNCSVAVRPLYEYVQQELEGGVPLHSRHYSHHVKQNKTKRTQGYRIHLT